MAMNWFPLYHGDYLRDTSDLSPEEHGIYLLLLMAFFGRGPLPDNLNRLCRISAGARPEDVRGILERYWERSEEGWINRKMALIRSNALIAHEKRVTAGREGGLAKASNARAMLEQEASNARAKLKQSHSNALGSQNQNQNQNQNHSQNQNQNQKPSSKLSEPASAGMSGSRPTLPPWRDVGRVLNALNAKTGRDYRVKNGDGRYSKNAEMVRARLKEHSIEVLLAIVDAKSAQWGNSEKMAQYLRPATLFNASKCEQYAGELSAPGASGYKWGSFLDEQPSEAVIEGECHE